MFLQKAQKKNFPPTALYGFTQIRAVDKKIFNYVPSNPTTTPYGPFYFRESFTSFSLRSCMIFIIIFFFNLNLYLLK